MFAMEKKPRRIHGPIEFVKREHPVLGLMYTKPMYPTAGGLTFGQRMAFLILLVLLNFVVYTGFVIVFEFLTPGEHRANTYGPHKWSWCDEVKYVQRKCKADFEDNYFNFEEYTTESDASEWEVNEETACEYSAKFPDDRVVSLQIGNNRRFLYPRGDVQAVDDPMETPYAAQSKRFREIFNRTIDMINSRSYGRDDEGKRWVKPKGAIPIRDAVCYPVCYQPQHYHTKWVDPTFTSKWILARDSASDESSRLTCKEFWDGNGEVDFEQLWYVDLMCIDFGEIVDSDCYDVPDSLLSFQELVFARDSVSIVVIIKIIITLFFVLPFTIALKTSMKVINTGGQSMFARAIAYPVFLGLATAAILMAYYLASSKDIGVILEHDGPGFVSALTTGQALEVPKLMLMYQCCMKKKFDRMFEELMEKWEKSASKKGKVLGARLTTEDGDELKSKKKGGKSNKVGPAPASPAGYNYNPGPSGAMFGARTMQMQRYNTYAAPAYTGGGLYSTQSSRNSTPNLATYSQALGGLRQGANSTQSNPNLPMFTAQPSSMGLNASSPLSQTTRTSSYLGDESSSYYSSEDGEPQSPFVPQSSYVAS